MTNIARWLHERLEPGYYYVCLKEKQERYSRETNGEELRYETTIVIAELMYDEWYFMGISDPVPYKDVDVMAKVEDPNLEDW